MQNEKRLIDANALSKSIKEGSGTELQKFFADICLATAPTVDAVEVVHGRWAKTDILSRRMGVGVRYYNHAECKVAPCRLVECEYDYCPFCGATMDGGNEDD